MRTPGTVETLNRLVIVTTPTIKDVAQRAGVSTATVSRVLSDSPRVRLDTRERVLEAMGALDYRPSAVARSLRVKDTAVVGLVVTDISNPFYPEVVRGVEDEIQRQGRSVLLCNSGDSAEREIAYLDLLIARRVDAVMVASGGLARRQQSRLVEFSRPVVFLNVASPDGRIPAVLSDNRLGGRLAAEHLVECGYQRLIYVSGPSESAHGSERQDGVLEGAEPLEVHVVEGGGDLHGGAAAIMEVAHSVEPPFGVVAHNDVTAVGVLSALRRMKLRVPDQVGVVGFDDIAWSAYVTPSLTTVAQDKYGMGVRAAQLVKWLLSGEDVSGTVRLPVRLIERDSTNRVGI